jgi:hypothetical protein
MDLLERACEKCKRDELDDRECAILVSGGILRGICQSGRSEVVADYAYPDITTTPKAPYHAATYGTKVVKNISIPESYL